MTRKPTSRLALRWLALAGTVCLCVYVAKTWESRNNRDFVYKDDHSGVLVRQDATTFQLVVTGNSRVQSLGQEALLRSRIDLEGRWLVLAFPIYATECREYLKTALEALARDPQLKLAIVEYESLDQLPTWRPERDWGYRSPLWVKAIDGNIVSSSVAEMDADSLHDWFNSPPR